MAADIVRCCPMYNTLKDFAACFVYTISLMRKGLYCSNTEFNGLEVGNVV